MKISKQLAHFILFLFDFFDVHAQFPSIVSLSLSVLSLFIFFYPYAVCHVFFFLLTNQMILKRDQTHQLLSYFLQTRFQAFISLTAICSFFEYLFFTLLHVKCFLRCYCPPDQSLRDLFSLFFQVLVIKNLSQMLLFQGYSCFSHLAFANFMIITVVVTTFVEIATNSLLQTSQQD